MMIPRRQVLTAGLVGGTLGTVAEAHAGEPLQSSGPSDRGAREIAEAVRSVRTELQSQRAFPEIAAIRDAQRTYLRANGRFPEYIEVGIDVWFAAYDWHVRWQQPVAVSRDTSNRYTLALLATTVVMRTDTQPEFIGLPYDNR